MISKISIDEYLKLIEEIDQDDSSESNITLNELDNVQYRIKNSKIKNHSIKVDQFLLISRWDDKIHMNVSLYENVLFKKKYIMKKIDLHLDSRFVKFNIKKYFNQYTKVGNNLKNNEFEEIINSLHRIKKLKSFL